MNRTPIAHLKKARAVADAFEMPFGVHLGKRLRDVPVDYLLWAVSRAGIRHCHPHFVRPALYELRKRLAEPALCDQCAEYLLSKVYPPGHPNAPMEWLDDLV